MLKKLNDILDFIMKQVESQRDTKELLRPELTDNHRSKNAFKLARQNKSPGADAALINYLKKSW